MADRGERRFFALECLRLEEVRFQTFVDWRYANLRPRILSTNMLFSYRKKDLVKCFYCGVLMKDFGAWDDPNFIHGRVGKTCKFIRFPDYIGNVPMDEELQLEEPEQYGPSRSYPELVDPVNEEVFKLINSYYKFLISRTLPMPPERIWFTEAVKDLVVQSPNYPHRETFESRKITYYNWPEETGITVKEMSAGGFFYAGRVDWVRCFYCGGGLFGWQKGDDPSREHARYYSFCPFIREKLGEETVMEIVTENPPPMAEDRPIEFTAEEEELLLEHPICKKAIQMEWFTRDQIKFVMKRQIQLFGYPHKDFRALLTVLEDYFETELQRREREEEMARRNAVAEARIQEQEAWVQEDLKENAPPEASLGGAEASLGGAEASLGGAEASLGGAEASLAGAMANELGLPLQQDSAVADLHEDDDFYTDY